MPKKSTLARKRPAANESAFEGTSALESINLQDTAVTAIGKNAFLKSGISEIILPDSCEEIKSGAFSQCSLLEKVLIPASVTTIDDAAFNSSNKVTIYCYESSAAHVFAEVKGIPYVLLEVPEPEKYLLGDADTDGEILINDATVIQRVLAHLPVASFDERNADVNGDELDISDATQIQRYIAELPVNSPIGEWIIVE